MPSAPTPAVLVVRTLPGCSPWVARVTASVDIGRHDEMTVVVQSLSGLLAIVAQWWDDSWGDVAPGADEK